MIFRTKVSKSSNYQEIKRKNLEERGKNRNTIKNNQRNALV